MDRLRILVVSNLFPPNQSGGYELSCASFVAHARAQGAAVTVLTIAGGIPSGDDEVFQQLRPYARPGKLLGPTSLRTRLSIERANHRVLERHVDHFAPEAVMWWNMKGLPASLIAQISRKEMTAIGVICDRWMLTAEASDPWLRLGRRSNAAGRAADAWGIPSTVDWSSAARWVFVSEHVRRATIHGLGPLARTDIVHSGIDVGAIDERPADTPWSKRLLIAGRVSPEKGFATALRALAELPGYTLTVSGGGSGHVAELNALALELGVTAQVHLLGPLSPEAMAAAYRDHDVLLFPIEWDEPWGKVPLEAMAAGVPVVARARGGTAEYLQDGQNCLLADNAEEFAAQVRRLAAEPALRAALVTSGLATAHANDSRRADAGRLSILEDEVARTAVPRRPTAKRRARRR